MSITKNSVGFTQAALRAKNAAQIFAEYDDGEKSEGFYVGLETADHLTGEGWYFDEAGCREAAEFFNMLGDEIVRRNPPKSRGKKS